MDCQGCTCVKNYDGDSEFCGRLVRNDEKGLTTQFGCDTKCEQCKSCNYSSSSSGNNNSNSNNNNNNGNSNNNGINSNTLDRESFLKILKRQQELNTQNNLVRGQIVSDETNPTDQEKMAQLQKNLSPNSNFDQNNGINNEIIEPSNEINCVDLDKGGCTKEKGCGWNADSIVCSPLRVGIYSSEKLDGTHYTLGVGNYDLSDINNLDFLPEFIAVPQGLRVKIWYKEGFVGMYNAYLGNHSPDSLVDKNLHKVKNLGSIQICNMVNCDKPSPYANMKLINIMEGNNIDRIDKNEVQNVAEYKDKLRKNIINRIKYIRNNQHECLQEVINYLRHNGIDLHTNFDQEEDINRLQKVKFLLMNLPSCHNLQVYKNYKNKNEEKRLTALIKKHCNSKKSGKCKIELTNSSLNPEIDNIKLITEDQEIDVEMVNSIEDNIIEEENMGPSNSSPSSSNLNNNNNNKKVKKLLQKINDLEKQEPEIIYQQAPAETKIVYQQAPAETKIVYQDKIVYQQTPAETKIVYQEKIVPGEEKIVYRDAPCESGEIKKEDLKYQCDKAGFIGDNIGEETKLLGVKVKGNTIMEKIYNYTMTPGFRSGTLIIILIIVLYLIRVVYKLFFSSYY